MIPDRDQRRRAVLTPHHAFVWASAGTGKTHTLTLRALYLLLTLPTQKAAAGTEPDALYRATSRAERLRAARAVLRQLVLTTFTRKAAAEMQTRLYEYLDRLASAPDAAALRATIAQMHHGHGDEQFQEVVDEVLARVGSFDRLRAGAEALAELATELPVCTLHSYAAAILRRHPIAAGLPPNVQLAEEDEPTDTDPAEQLVDRWWAHALADPHLHRQLEQLLATLPLGDLREWLVQIVHAPWIVDELDFGKPQARELANLLDATEQLVAGLQAVRSNATKIIAARDALANVVRQARVGAPGAWLEFCKVLLRHQDDIWSNTKTVTNAKAGLGRLARCYESFEAAYVPVLQQCLATERAELWQVWRSFARSFAAWAEGAVLRELNLVTFKEMVRRAAWLLATNAEVRRIERERLRALLVDEFQDTDPVQLELLGHLLRRESAHDHEVLGFFVGDPKQSIYRFRDADLPAIQRFAADYVKLVRAKPGAVIEVRLTASFRSRPAILRFVNHFFSHCIPLPNYAQEQLQAVRHEDGPKPDWRLMNAAPGAKIAARRELAAKETVRLIHEYAQQAGGGASAYSDVVVLVRSHDELAALLPVLEQAQIPAVSSGAKTFYQKPEVLDVLNLLIALHNPHDSLAIGALLRSPLVGLADRVSYQLLLALRPAEVVAGAAPLPAAVPAVSQERITALRRLAANRTQAACADWLDQVRAFIPVAVYARYDSEGRAGMRIDAVLAAFRRVVEQGRIPPLVWLLDQRARVSDADRFDAELGEDVSVTDESVAAVRVMTIHKAKGLEGRFVIVYGWQNTLAARHAALHNKQSSVLRLTGTQGNLLSGFRLAWGDLLAVSPGYATALAAARQAEAAEACRLAYVAATRARDRLVLLSQGAEELQKGLLAGNGADPAVAVLGGTASVSLVEAVSLPELPAAQAHRLADERAYKSLWSERLRALAQPPVPLLQRPTQPEQPAEQEESDPGDYLAQRIEQVRAAALAVGTLVHAYLERYLTSARFDAAKLAGIDPAAAPETRARAAAVLELFYGSAQHELARHSRLLGREIPLYLMDKGGAWHGLIDLVLEAEGGILGVDYKVMKQPAELPPEYARQQQLYTEALRRLYPDRPVRFEFWWLAGS